MLSGKRSGLELIHQYVYEVVDFSSQYGSEDGTSYSAGNLVGPCRVYPNYCDSSATCSFRTFGRWCRECPSALKPIASPPHGYTSEDYVDLYFDVPVIPARLQIFETYNPGAVVRILACYRTQPADGPVNSRKLQWFTLWEAAHPSSRATTPSVRSTLASPLQLPGPERANTTRELVLSRHGLPRRLSIGHPRNSSADSYFRGCFTSAEYGQHACVFEPPLVNVPPYPTDLIRVEFDGSLCPYYTELDAVRLTGWAEVSRWTRSNQIEGIIPTVPTRFSTTVTELDDGITTGRSEQTLSFFSDLLRPRTPQMEMVVDRAQSKSESLNTSLSDLSTSSCSSPSPKRSSCVKSLSTYLPPKNFPDATSDLTVTRLCRLPSLGFDLLLPRAGHAFAVAPGTICPASLFGLNRVDETALWRHGPLTRLPYEVLLYIFSFLDFQTICRTALVSRLFRCLADDALAQLSSLNLQAYCAWLTDAKLLSLGRRLGRVNLTARAAAVATTGNSVIPYTLLRRLEAEEDVITQPARHRVRRGLLAARVRSWSTSAPTGIHSELNSPSGCSFRTSPRGPTYPVNDPVGVASDIHDRSVDILEAYLAAFPQCRLQRLDMSWCGNYSLISPTAFGDFLSDACRRLTSLRLSSCKFLNDDCLLHVVNTCRQLEEFDLSSCTGITAHGFFTLGRLIRLRWLSLYRTHITDEGVINISELCQHLQHLNLGSCVDVRDMDRVLESLTKNNSSLISLNLWRCVTVSAVGIDHLIRSCSLLEELDLGWCRNILLTQDETSCVVRLVQQCRRIRRLLLTGTSLLNSQELIVVGQTISEHLEQLDIQGSENVNAAAVAILLSQCPRLRLLDVSFCRQILWHHVMHLRRLFPLCTIITVVRDLEADHLGNPVHRVLVEELMGEFMERLQLAFGRSIPPPLPPGPILLALPAPYLLPAITGPVPE